MTTLYRVITTPLGRHNYRFFLVVADCPAEVTTFLSGEAPIYSVETLGDLTKLRGPKGIIYRAETTFDSPEDL